MAGLWVHQMSYWHLGYDLTKNLEVFYYFTRPKFIAIWAINYGMRKFLAAMFPTQFCYFRFVTLQYALRNSHQSSALNTSCTTVLQNQSFSPAGETATAVAYTRWPTTKAINSRHIGELMECVCWPKMTHNTGCSFYLFILLPYQPFKI